MGSLPASLRSLIREMRRTPGFLLVAVLTLAVGIGANVAIFTVVNAVLIRPLPYAEPERLVMVWHTAPGLKMEQFEHSDATYVLYRRHNRVLEDLGIYWDGSVTLTGGEAPERLRAAGLTASVFSVLRVPPLLGRSLHEADERPGAEKVAVLSHELWRRRFGRDPQAVGESFSLVVKSRMDPASLIAPVRQAIWSLDPNLPLAQVRPMQEVVERSMARTSFTMLLLVIAAAVALLLGTVGIYGVNSYAVSQRTREIGVRMALGAGRRDISRMVLREGFLLAAAGIAIGLAGALLVTRLMLALLYDVSPMDPLTFATVPALLALVALLASWLPARRAASVEPLEAIRYE